MYAIAMRHLVLGLGLLAGLLGCSAETTEAPAPTSPDPSVTPEPAALAGTLRFFVPRNGAPAEVTQIVYTEALSTRLDGLPPGTEVTITATVLSPSFANRGYVAKGTFVTDANGIVDTATQPSKGGTYTGLEPDGLLWSGIDQKLAESPGPDRLGAYFVATVGDAVVARATLRRLFQAEGITVEKVSAGGLVGELFLPRGASDAVPVVAFGGSEGGIGSAEMYAARAATLGHPALALAYFGAPGVPKELAEIPLEYFAKAFAWLDGRAEMRKGNVVVIGGSRGGELALQLAATFPQVVGAIGETPSVYRWGAVSTDKKSAWTYEGKALPYVPSVSAGFPPTEPGPGGAPAYVLVGEFQTDMARAKPEELEAARIRVEDAKGAILMLAGADDKLWPACDFTARAMTVLQASGHAARLGDEGVCFPGAGHAVGFLGIPTTQSMWSVFDDGTVLALGGSATANAHAARQGAEKIASFLARVTR